MKENIAIPDGIQPKSFWGLKTELPNDRAKQSYRLLKTSNVDSDDMKVIEIWKKEILSELSS